MATSLLVLISLLVFSLGPYIAYFVLVHRHRFSLLQKWLLLLLLWMVSCLAMWVVAGVSAGSFEYAWMLPAIFALPGVLICVGSWIFDWVAIWHGARDLRLAREARARGEYDAARRYEEWFRRDVFRITIYGGAKELDALVADFQRPDESSGSGKASVS